MKRLIQSYRRHGEHGGIALEAAIIAPALLMLLVLIIGAGRVGGAHSAIDSAAANAARAASISRTSGEAQSQAQAAAVATLSGQGTSCPSPSVSVDTSGLGAPIGQVGVVTVTVTCAVQLGDLAGVPIGARTVTGEASSVVDAYRGRGDS